MSYVETIRKKIGHDVLLLHGSNVIILDTQKRFLLQKRKNGNWSLLGGLLEIDETIEEAAVREVYEEAKLTISNLQLINIFSGPKYHRVLENKDEIYVIITLFYAKSVSGVLQIDNQESFDLQYFAYDSLPASLEDTYREFIQYFVTHSNMFT